MVVTRGRSVLLCLMLPGLVLLAVIGGGISLSPASRQQVSAATRGARWLADLDMFAAKFPGLQKDFFKLMSQDEFNIEIGRLKEEIPQLSDAEISFRLMRLVARLGVGHSTVRWPSGSIVLHYYPLMLYWFSDGLGVIAAGPEYSSALGTHILRMGTMTAEQVEAAITPYISHENEPWVHQKSPSFMINAELLRYLGIADAENRLELSLAKPGGRPFSLQVSPSDPSIHLSLTDAAEVTHAPVPLYRKQSGSYYWYECLPNVKVLYVQYNRCQDDPKLSFKDFVDRMFAFADRQPVDRVVVDLRFNSGGNSNVIKPLESSLNSRRALTAKGHLYVLIGRATFSSGLMAAIDFHDNLHAILVGEPTGEKPNSYGEVRTLDLPNSHLAVAYTVKYFRLMKDADPAALFPDIQVPRSLDDYLNGRDPILDAALHHQPSDDVKLRR